MNKVTLVAKGLTSCLSMIGGFGYCKQPLLITKLLSITSLRPYSVILMRGQGNEEKGEKKEEIMAQLKRQNQKGSTQITIYLVSSRQLGAKLG